jgi:hypothetical protein
MGTSRRVVRFYFRHGVWSTCWHTMVEKEKSGTVLE